MVCAVPERVSSGLKIDDVFDRAASTYDVAPFPFFTPFGEALVEFAAIQSHERVLDVGCGAGAALAPAARVAASAVGVELSPVMAERARTVAPAAEVRVGDASKLDFEDGSFDIVLSAFTVFFMPDPTAALTEWRRVLAPGGRIVLSTWAGGDPRWEFERRVRRSYMSEVDPAALKDLGEGLARLQRFDDAEKVAAELATAGFKNIEQDSHAIDFVFADEQAWWDWNWSHGTRAVMEAVPEEPRERYRAEIAEAMEQIRESNGFPRTFTSVFTRGISG
jgi:ubiquinone/menaquinone biosynthesis C-methylase UbiE